MKSVDLLSKSLDLFLEMKELAKKQKALILDDQSEAFLELSLQRDRLQREISDYEGKYRTIMKDRPANRMEKRESTISREIMDAIKSIQEIDRKIEELVLEKRNGLFSDIKNIRHGQKALKGYGGKSSEGGPRFIDRQS